MAGPTISQIVNPKIWQETNDEVKVDHTEKYAK
jgi:hypothetical protein